MQTSFCSLLNTFAAWPAGSATVAVEPVSIILLLFGVVASSLRMTMEALAPLILSNRCISSKTRCLSELESATTETGFQSLLVMVSGLHISTCGHLLGLP